MSNQTRGYDAAFFREMSADATRAARRVVPVLVNAFRPRSVVDVGCGTGAWLAEFRRAGIEDIAGFDGEWVPADALEIPRECFSKVELSEPLTAGRRFDLVVSLEVAEHLPARAAAAFVRSLGSLGDIVVFSAAIPFQGGVGHVNEQWPAYWIDLFEDEGFLAYDPLRALFWSDPDVPWYYAQNMLVFVSEAECVRRQEAIESLMSRSRAVLPLVHPQRHLMAQSLRTAGLRDLLSALPHAFTAALKRRLPG